MFTSNSKVTPKVKTVSTVNRPRTVLPKNCLWILGCGRFFACLHLSEGAGFTRVETARDQGHRSPACTEISLLMTDIFMITTLNPCRNFTVACEKTLT
jgi:hypothetical protein